MRQIIRQIYIPTEPRTGIIEEREMFAKLLCAERKGTKKARRLRILAVLRWKRRDQPVVKARCRRTEQPTHAAGSAAGTPEMSP